MLLHRACKNLRMWQAVTIGTLWGGAAGGAFMPNDDANESVTGEPTGPTVPDEPDGAPRRGRPLRWLSLGVLGVALSAAGYVGWTQVKPMVDARRYANVSDEVPVAPQLTAAEGETVYRIDPTRSSLTYEIEEKLVGHSRGSAVGVSQGIAGDIALNHDELADSRVGQIVVNIEQFRSDNNLRDARIRQDFLQSHRYPLATFDTDEIVGLAGQLEEGEEYSFTLEGNATVKNTPAPATWQATAVLEDGVLTATATTTAKLSRFDAGPISIAGLVATEDEIQLTLAITAVDPTTTEIASVVEHEIETAAEGEGPSFAKEVQPIIEANCAVCHNSGQMASRHLRIDTAADAQEISDGIKTVTQARYMPPWPASDEGVPLMHDARLSDEDLATLAAWSDAGGQLDVPAETKITMTEEKADLLPRKDVTLKIDSYLGVATNRNDYRCFVLDPELDEAQFFTGYTFEADQLQQLHHAQVFHISEEQKQSAAKLDGADGRNGWQCYSSPSIRGEKPDRRYAEKGQRDVGFAGQSNLVAGWVPGQSPSIFPESSGVLMEPGDALVLQIHYHFASDPVPDESGLSLQLSPVDGNTKRLRVVNPLAPVEIPCSPEDVDAPLCDRDAALAENVRLYGHSGASTEGALLGLCGHDPAGLTADFDGFVANSSCNLRVPESGTITAVQGHMHTIGNTLRLTLGADTPDEKILLDIPQWSFDWQMSYGLAEPLHVEAGTPVRLECSWDRRKAPDREPKYIVFAEGTEDEMCFATYVLIPDNQ